MGWAFVFNSLIYVISYHIELGPWDFSVLPVLDGHEDKSC